MVSFSPEDLAAWSGGTWGGDIPDQVTGVCIDSRLVQPGQLYIALPGARVDGHDYVEEALARGAAAALVASGRCQEQGRVLPLLYVEDTRRALTKIAYGHRAQCHAHVIGITGSVGKTSVKEMLADILARTAPTARTRGNWNNDLGLPLSLMHLKPNDAYGVFEVGMNHPGELEPLCQLLQPRSAIITPIGPVHMEFFESLEGIAEEKATLLAALPDDGWSVLCSDDPWYMTLRKRAKGRVITVSNQRKDADFMGGGDERGALTVHEADGSDYRYALPLPGDYVKENALRVIAAARTLGVPQEVIAEALSRYKPPAMRWNLISISSVSFINDAYNANPMSMRAALKAFRDMPTRGRRWLVLAGMYELGRTEREEHAALGRAVAMDHVWAGLITVGERGEWIAEGARQAGMPETAVHVCASVEKASDVLSGHAGAGDAVLLKASRSERLENVLTAFEKRMALENDHMLL